MIFTQQQHFKALKHFPYFQNNIEMYEPVAERLAYKHKALPSFKAPLPCIHVYHRSTRH